MERKSFIIYIEYNMYEFIGLWWTLMKNINLKYSLSLLSTRTIMITMVYSLGMILHHFDGPICFQISSHVFQMNISVLTHH